MLTHTSRLAKADEEFDRWMQHNCKDKVRT